MDPDPTTAQEGVTTITKMGRGSGGYIWPGVWKGESRADLDARLYVLYWISVHIREYDTCTDSPPCRGALAHTQKAKNS